MTEFLRVSTNECRRAAKALWRNPVFTLSVLALLTVAIGTVTAVGAAAYELLKGPLPYGHADRLVMIWSDLPKSGYLRAPLSGPEVVDLRTRSHGFTDVAVIFPGNTTLSHSDTPVQIGIGTVTHNFFATLGVAPLHGRLFTAEDEGNGKAPTIVLSWALWQDRFGGDPSIVGRTIEVGSQQTMVIGVMPPAFRMAFPPDANIPGKTEAWLPFSWDVTTSPRHRYFLRTIARLRDGVTVDAASSEVQAIATSLEREFPGYAASGRTMFAVKLDQDLAAPVRIPATALGFAGLLLVLLAFVNLSGLWVARAVTQRTEHGIQQALGASLQRVRAQLVIQAAMLSALGCALGFATAAAGLAALRQVRPLSLARIDYATLTLPVMLGVLGLVFASTVFLTLVSGASVAPLLASGVGRTRLDAAPRYRIRATLVIAQVALALVLLVCSVLWTRTFLNVLNTDAGFRPEHALTFRYSIDPLRLRTDAEMSLIGRQLNEAVSAIPAVTAAGTISHLPFDHLPNWSMSYRAAEAEEGATREADVRPVSPGFLNAIGARIRSGRFLTESDDLPAPRVVVVDRALAERTWPDQDPIGRRLLVATWPGIPPTAMTVVGVLEHVRYRAIETQVREQLYIPLRQIPYGPYAFIVRSSSDLSTLVPAIRARIRGVDARVPVWDFRPLQDYYDEATGERRFTAILLMTFAIAALVLASIGVYGLLTYIVLSRRGEFGVRMALGAGRHAIAASVLREGLQWAVAGALIGAVLLFPAVSRLAGALYGVTPHDPLSWIAAALLLLTVVGLASWIPAFRAGRSDLSLLMRSQ